VTDTRWIIEHRGIGRLEVRGFTNREKARDHVRKHFLNPKEQWEQICKNPGPAYFLARLDKASSHTNEGTNDGTENREDLGIQEEAAERYVDTVRRYSAREHIIKAGFVLHEPDESTGVLRRICLVSSAGFFSAFNRDSVSDLATAYRPVFWPARGFLTIQHYVDAARDKFANAMTRTQLLQGKKRTKKRKKKKKTRVQS
jgi:hypothetical protein